MTKSLKILNTKVTLRAFEIAAIAAQLTSDLSQEPLLAVLRGLFLPTGESFLFALDISITGFEQDWTELRSFEVLHLNASFIVECVVYDAFKYGAALNPLRATGPFI